MDLHNIALLQSALKTIAIVCDKTVDCSDCPFLACPIVPVIEWERELDNAFQIELKRTKEDKKEVTSDAEIL